MLMTSGGAELPVGQGEVHRAASVGAVGAAARAVVRGHEEEVVPKICFPVGSQGGVGPLVREPIVVADEDPRVAKFLRLREEGGGSLSGGAGVGGRTVEVDEGDRAGLGPVKPERLGAVVKGGVGGKGPGGGREGGEAQEAAAGRGGGGRQEVGGVAGMLGGAGHGVMGIQVDAGFLDGKDVEGGAARKGQDLREAASQGGNIERADVDGVPGSGKGGSSHGEVEGGPAGKWRASMMRRAAAW